MVAEKSFTTKNTKRHEGNYCALWRAVFFVHPLWPLWSTLFLRPLRILCALCAKPSYGVGVAEEGQRLYATGPSQFFPILEKQEFFMHAKSMAVAMLLVFGAAAPAAMPATAAQAAPVTQLKIIDTKVGNGAVAKAGQQVTVHYTGWLYVNGARGKKFDSSVDRGEPFTFPLGAGQVIPGWDKGVAGMKVGGKRTLIIPSDMGYGAGGTPDGTIPPNATLIFDVELLKVGS